MKSRILSHLHAALAAIALLVSHAPAQGTARVSVDSTGAQGNATSLNGSISPDGRYVAFDSAAFNLVPGDSNSATDVFVHDRQTGTTSRVSVDSAGAQGNNSSHFPSISSDGRYVAFLSFASNLVAGDSNSNPDVFVHDLQTGQTSRVSVDSAGVQGNSFSNLAAISSDGRYVAFESFASNLVLGDVNGGVDIFVHDRQTSQTSRVSVDSAGVQGNGSSTFPAISSDGRYVAFESFASNLVSGDTNGNYDVFVHDRQTGQTGRVSVDSASAQGTADSRQPTVSSDGRYVAFYSIASNLVPGDTNAAIDSFVRDRQTGQTSRVSVDSSGVQGNATSSFPSVSSDGRYVAFGSQANNLDPADTNGVSDVFVHDRQTGQTSRISVNSAGAQGNNLSYGPRISSDGRYVAFVSNASDLVLGDTNSATDAFVRDRGAAAGPTLAKSGTCPGAAGLTVANATPSGSVALLYGSAGVFVQSGTPCTGLTLGISTPTLGAVVAADGAGSASVNFVAPAGVCGSTVQAVDLATCAATNTVVL